jgi:squalene-hopene/tetraprenyl-beta-curcumene cyclase
MATKSLTVVASVLLAAFPLLGQQQPKPANLDTIANPQDLPPVAQTDAQARAHDIIVKGLAYLKTQQKPDGSWQSDRDPPAITAIVLKAFVQSPPYSYKDDFIARGYAKLLSYQLPDGGIYKDLLANYNTSIAISALSAANNPEFKPHIDAAVAYLKKLQWNNPGGIAPEGETVPKQWQGGWGYGGRSRGGGRPDLSNVQLAMDALKDAGLKPGDPAFEAAVTFVTRQQNLSQTNDQPWASNDGGFVYGPGDKGQGESMAGAFNDNAGARRLRSYGSMTYAGLKSYIYASLSKDDPRVKAAFDWISQNYTLDANPGMGDPALSQAGLYYYFHTLARALNAYDVPTITDAKGASHDWRLELIGKLAQLQKPDGSFSGDAKWMESNPVLVTSYVVLALQEVERDLREHAAK